MAGEDVKMKHCWASVRARGWVTAAIGAAVLSLLAAPASATYAERGVTTGATLAAAEPRIAYSDGNDIWLTSPTGTGKTNITNSPDTYEYFSSISYDGRFVVFDSSSVNGRDIFVYDVATKQTSQITTDGRSGQPDFSPIDYRIAFVRGNASGSLNNIFTMSKSGANVTSWTKDSAPAAGALPLINRMPSWSPDAQEIYFVSSRDGYNCIGDPVISDKVFQALQLYKTTQAGSLTQVTNNPYRSISGSSVRGTSLAYNAEKFEPYGNGGPCRIQPLGVNYLFVDGVELTRSGGGNPTWLSNTEVGFWRPMSTGSEVASIAASGGTVKTLFLGMYPNAGLAYMGQVQEPSTISLNYTNTPEIRANGQVVPAHVGTTVTVRLAVDRGGSWVTVGTKHPTLSARSRYVVQFAKPSDWMCRLTASFPGDADHKASKTIRQFSC